MASPGAMVGEVEGVAAELELERLELLEEVDVVDADVDVGACVEVVGGGGGGGGGVPEPNSHEP